MIWFMHFQKLFRNLSISRIFKVCHKLIQFALWYIVILLQIQKIKKQYRHFELILVKRTLSLEPTTYFLVVFHLSVEHFE